MAVVIFGVDKEKGLGLTGVQNLNFPIEATVTSQFGVFMLDSEATSCSKSLTVTLHCRRVGGITQ